MSELDPRCQSSKAVKTGKPKALFLSDLMPTNPTTTTTAAPTTDATPLAPTLLLFSQLFDTRPFTVSYDASFTEMHRLVANARSPSVALAIHTMLLSPLLDFAAKLSTTPDDALLEQLMRHVGSLEPRAARLEHVLPGYERSALEQRVQKVRPLFAHTVSRYLLGPLWGRIRGVVLGLIETHRKSDAASFPEQHIMAESLGFLTRLPHLNPNSKVDNAYLHNLHPHIIDATRRFYAASLESWTSGPYDVPSVIQLIQVLLSLETARWTGYIPAVSLPALTDTFNAVLVEGPSVGFIEHVGSGAKVLLRTDNVPAVVAMADLFSRSDPASQALAATFGDVVHEDVKVCIVATSPDPKATPKPEPGDPTAMFEGVAQLMTRFGVFLKALDSPRQFVNTVNVSLKAVLNHSIVPAKFLAHALHLYMIRGCKGVADADADAHLDRLVAVFPHLVNKDVFENEARFLLQDRLLGSKSLSSSLETRLVSGLKAISGKSFTAKMERMLTDVETSTSLLKEFSTEDRTIKISNGVRLDASVLTLAHWNVTPSAPIRLPPWANPILTAFEEFYTQRKGGVKLQPIADRARATLSVRKSLFGKPYSFDVSLFQMAILGFFETADTKVTVATVHAETKIPMEELKRHALSLTTPKAPILVKTPKSKSVGVTDVFSLNPKFSSRNLRVKVPLVKAKKRIVTDELDEDVRRARDLALDAAIVRTMKARKTLSHVLLVQEVASNPALTFRPEVRAIKRRIEDLIGREYLERDDSSRGTYHYVA